MKILITGGCGFLGSNLANSILTNSHDELFVLDNLTRSGSEINLKWMSEKGSFKYYKNDIRNQDDICKIIKDIKPDVIFHLAGQVAMTTSIQNPRLDFETNVLGTINILESVRNFSPDTFVIYSSTNKVYGDLEWVKYNENETRYLAEGFNNGFPEDIPLSFQSPYGCSKGSADQYLLDYHRIYGINTAVFRHSSMFGQRQFSTYDQGWIGWFCQKALEIKNETLNEVLTISGNGKQVRDVLFADDMVDLYLKAVENKYDIAGQAFNIGGGHQNSLSLIELFQILETELDIEITTSNLPTRISDQKVFIADIDKANKFIKWTPKIDKLTGIRRMLEWRKIAIQ
jgi:CDP-paratose 2-epimerase